MTLVNKNFLIFLIAVNTIIHINKKNENAANNMYNTPNVISNACAVGVKYTASTVCQSASLFIGINLVDPKLFFNKIGVNSL